VKVNNKLPSVKILTETKINPQSLNDFMNEAGVSEDWEDSQLRRNLNVKLSDTEKFPEVVWALNNELKVSTSEFNNEINRSLLKSIHISVGINNVSNDCVFEISQNSSLSVHSTPLKDEISFWVNPCLIEDDKASMFYGMAISEASKKVEELRKYIEKATTGTPQEKDRAVSKLFPLASQINCIAFGSLYDWQRLIYEGTDFNKLDELRFILIELTRKLKLKYPSLFNNFILVNSIKTKFFSFTVN
jgi:hypothetical protein